MGNSDFAEQTVSGLLDIPKSPTTRQKIIKKLAEIESVQDESLDEMDKAIARLERIRQRRIDKYGSGTKK